MALPNFSPVQEQGIFCSRLQSKKNVLVFDVCNPRVLLRLAISGHRHQQKMLMGQTKQSFVDQVTRIVRMQKLKDVVVADFAGMRTSQENPPCLIHAPDTRTTIPASTLLCIISPCEAACTRPTVNGSTPGKTIFNFFQCTRSALEYVLSHGTPWLVVQLEIDIHGRTSRVWIGRTPITTRSGDRSSVGQSSRRREQK